MADALTDKILEAAALVAGGDVSKARRWYELEPLREFDGRTASQLVADGRGADVLRLVQSYEDGFLG